MKNRYILTTVLLLTLSLSSCFDERITDFITFEDDTVTSYLEKTENYSEFLRLMQSCEMDVMLTTRGNYTCFIPTNEAMEEYYKARNTNYETLTQTPGLAKDLVYDHIISGITIDYNSFDPGMISNATMSGRFIQIKKDNIDSIFVNRISHILRDSVKVVHNGSILPVDKVVEFSKVNLPEMIESDGRFALFASALFATGLADSLRATEDFEYKELRRRGTIPQYDVSKLASYNGYRIKTPDARKYGFTLFGESDETLKQAFLSAGVTGDGLDALRAFAKAKYPDGASFEDTDPRSSLYQFTAYHLLYFLVDENQIIPAKWRNSYYKTGLEVSDYAETMSGRLIEFKRTSGTGAKLVINQSESGAGVSIVPAGSKENASENGIFHEIDNVLLYDDNVINYVLNKRIRIDIISLMPELITNKIRGTFADEKTAEGVSMQYQSIPTAHLQYLENCICSSTTQMIYCGGFPNDLQYDELIFAGKYDVLFRLPSVPPGTYEIRMGYTANGLRSVTQVYFDGEPCGIPLDLKITASDPRIGFEVDNGDAEHDRAIDKAMRNRGYMKYPDILSSSTYGRNNTQTIRKIITMKTFNEEGRHYLRFKSVDNKENAEFMIDFIEFVPKIVWDSEDIY